MNQKNILVMVVILFLFLGNETSIDQKEGT